MDSRVDAVCMEERISKTVIWLTRACKSLCAELYPMASC